MVKWLLVLLVTPEHYSSLHFPFLIFPSPHLKSSMERTLQIHFQNPLQMQTQWYQQGSVQECQGKKSYRFLAVNAKNPGVHFTVDCGFSEEIVSEGVPELQQQYSVVRPLCYTCQSARKTHRVANSSKKKKRRN